MSRSNRRYIVLRRHSRFVASLGFRAPGVAVFPRSARRHGTLLALNPEDKWVMVTLFRSRRAAQAAIRRTVDHNVGERGIEDSANAYVIVLAIEAGGSPWAARGAT